MQHLQMFVRVKITAHSLVRPHLKYVSGAWYPHTMKNSDSLETMHRRAARSVKRDYVNKTIYDQSQVTALDWFALLCSRTKSGICTFYKADSRLSSIGRALNNDVQHSRSTRSSSES